MYEVAIPILFAACEEKTNRVVETASSGDEVLPFQQKMTLFLEKSETIFF